MDNRKCKKLHFVYILSNCGENVLAVISVSNWLIKIIIDENIVGNQTSNTDEMDLNYRMFVQQTFAQK